MVMFELTVLEWNSGAEAVSGPGGLLLVQHLRDVLLRVDWVDKSLEKIKMWFRSSPVSSIKEDTGSNPGKSSIKRQQENLVGDIKLGKEFFPDLQITNFVG